MLTCIRTLAAEGNNHETVIMPEGQRKKKKLKNEEVRKVIAKKMIFYDRYDDTIDLHDSNMIIYCDYDCYYIDHSFIVRTM
jgi:hypothetical protein